MLATGRFELCIPVRCGVNLSQFHYECVREGGGGLSLLFLLQHCHLSGSSEKLGNKRLNVELRYSSRPYSSESLLLPFRLKALREVTAAVTPNLAYSFVVWHQGRASLTQEAIPKIARYVSYCRAVGNQKVRCVNIASGLNRVVSLKHITKQFMCIYIYILESVDLPKVYKTHLYI